VAFPALSRLSPLSRFAAILGAATIAIAALATPRPAAAEALLLIEADTGKVLQAENATYPWYPASITKLMTAYVTLMAVKQGRITLDTLLTVSPTASAQSPSKMGFAPGTHVTVDNALKMMMVKSANDMAVVLAEGVGGSIDGFSAQMNQAAQRLGMTQTSYVNPNGLPADGQITSARDIAILARAIFRDLPEYSYFVHIPAIKFGRRITRNFNKLIGRYPGADGMKTGFICASGFNLVASATRNNRHLIAVVLGASSSAQRSLKAAQLLERGFQGNKLAWLKPSLGTVDALAPIDASPPNLREEMCGPKRKRPAAETDDDDIEISASGSTSPVAMFASGALQAPGVKMSDLLAAPAAPAEPVIVYTGPTKTGAALVAADAAESDKQAAQVRARKSKKAPHASPKVAAKPGTKTDSKADVKTDSKSAKPDSKAKHAAKPAASADAKASSRASKPAAARPAHNRNKPAAAAGDTPKSAAAKPKSAKSDKATGTAGQRTAASPHR
jgi:D-alanyl-D-alanine carboxypeptidase